MIPSERTHTYNIMRFSTGALLLLVAVVGSLDQTALAAAKKPSRPTSSSGRGGPPGSKSASSSRRPPVSKRRYDAGNEDEEEDVGFDDPLDDEEEDEEIEIDIEADFEEEDEDIRPRPRKSKSPGKRLPPSKKKSSNASSSRYIDDEDEDYRPRRPPGARKSPPPGRGRGPPQPARRDGRGRVIPYTKQQPSAFSRYLDGIKSSMPDPSSVKEAAIKSLNVARETTSGLSANLYREVKGLTSSELEQVMLKATRPDDTPVKGKHAERLVGVTYQISAKYDIYDAVLRKLWAKMTEKDWRTNIKALYILHRFAADGSPEHAAALKVRTPRRRSLSFQRPFNSNFLTLSWCLSHRLYPPNTQARLRELRRTRDPKRKEKFFSSKLLLAGDNKPETAKFRAFMARYAHYVLLRAQMFGGLFDEIGSPPPSAKDKKNKSPPKPITATNLRLENLDAAKVLLKAGTACVLKDGEECENTALAVERVASDLLGLTAAVAMALNRALKDDDLKGADPVLIRKWCEFYSEELLPQTRAMVKRTTPKLDAFGLFLPSRMGASLSPDLLQKGLKLDEAVPAAEEGEEDEAADVAEKLDVPSAENQDVAEEDEEIPKVEAPPKEVGVEGGVDEVDDEEELDEYEYEEEEEYYDDEDEL